jgi:hypothetical protein
MNMKKELSMTEGSFFVGKYDSNLGLSGCFTGENGMFRYSPHPPPAAYAGRHLPPRGKASDTATLKII